MFFLPSMLFSTSFIPHGHCYLWQPGLVWLHLISDALTAIAYYSVAIAIIYFMHQRRDLPAKTVTLLAGYFFVFALCGITHFIDVVTLWHPIYWVSGLLKAANAFWSAYAFTFLLIPLIPVAIDTPSPAQLALTNQELEDHRNRIQAMNLELEQRVVERTAQLEASNRAKDELLLREQMIRAEAQAANRAKDEFLSTLSHELRTPLNAILGWAQMLRQRPLNPEQSQRALETIERNARSQAKLIEDILDISRVITGKLRLQVHPLNLIEVIQAAMESVQLAAEAKSIQIQTQFEISAQTIVGDADRLQQVIWNLLANAIKFTPAAGRVVIEVQRLEAEVEIIVSDTGQGIDPEFLPYAFDRFRQHDSSITRRFGGLGLGLALVRQLIELHGGTVGVASLGTGQGTTFTIRLPVLRPHPLTDAPLLPSIASVNNTAAVASTLTGVRVLVVEDEVDSLELLSLILRETGAEVVVAASVQAALAILETSSSQRPDVLVSDIGLPDEDGYSLIRQLRQRDIPHGGHMPAIALTAYASSDDRQRSLSAGFQRHLTKPVEAAELITAVASLTGRTG